MNATAKWVERLQTAISVIDGLEVDERVRATLRRACAESLATAEDALVEGYRNRNSGEKWDESALGELRRLLDAFGSAPTSWRDEDARLEQLSLAMGRSKKQIKTKALEIGRGKMIDYWLSHNA